MELNVTIVDVTPDLAKEWLTGNTRNRNLNAATVNDYARDMLSGNWELNGEAVKISASRILLDGQHRLQAVIDSGTTVPMLVVAGLPDGTQNTMDLGRKRTVGDQFAMAGEQYAKVLAAIARRVVQWDQGNRRFTSRPNPTAAEARAALDKYPHLRRSAEMGSRIALSFRPERSSVVGLSHHLFVQIDQDLTAEFFARLETGADLVKGHPILALRERLITDKVAQRHMLFHQYVAAHIRAWNALRLGEEMQIVKVPADLKMPNPI